jgi:hypothetical protein
MSLKAPTLYFNTAGTLIVFMLLISGLACLAQPTLSPLHRHAPAYDLSQPSYETRIIITPQIVPNHFTFKGTHFGTIIEVTLTISDPFDKERPEKLYEELWYSGSNIIGCVRHGPLDMKSGNTQIVMNDLGHELKPEEVAAASNAIVRAYLDVAVKWKMVHKVIIPDQYFDQAIVDLNNDNFYSPDEAKGKVTSPIMMLVASQNSDNQAILQYCE